MFVHFASNLIAPLVRTDNTALKLAALILELQDALVIGLIASNNDSTVNSCSVIRIITRVFNV